MSGGRCGNWLQRRKGHGRCGRNVWAWQEAYTNWQQDAFASLRRWVKGTCLCGGRHSVHFIALLGFLDDKSSATRKESQLLRSRSKPCNRIPWPELDPYSSSFAYG